MRDILGAVFGSAYSGGKSSFERKAAKIAKQKQEEWKQALNVWQKRMTNENLESELELYVYKHPVDAAQMARTLCATVRRIRMSCTRYCYIYQK